jgi:mannose-6-phosphate isomerase
MHLFESALAWEALGGPVWRALSDEIAGLAMDRFIEPASGALREFFDAKWLALEGEGGLVEPGHQFEWAWLLDRWGHARGDEAALTVARRLFENGLRGVDPARNVAVNALWDDFSVRDGAARLWPQTERLKAAVALGDEAQALSAARGLAQYLDVPARGAWRDKLRPDGSFIDEPAPATSFYHLMVAILELQARAGA